MKIQFFDDDLERFLQNLEKSTIAKVLHTIDLLERFGNDLGMPHSKKIGDRIFELRVRGKQEIRILFTYHKQSAVLLHGFVKKSQQIPQKELRLAQQKLQILT